MSEQWKTDGKCLECRRHGYCKTQCSKNKQAVRAFILQSLRNKLQGTGKEKEAEPAQ